MLGFVEEFIKKIVQLGFVGVAVAYIGLLPGWVGCDMLQHMSSILLL